MNKLRPNHVARCPVLIGPVFPHPCFDFRFNFPHRLVHRNFERIQNPFIFGELVSHRNRLWTMEIEIVADGAIAFVPLRQPFICPRFLIITQGLKCLCVSPRPDSPNFCAPIPCQSPLIS